jgi:release factor glutamine methyltransferase
LIARLRRRSAEILAEAGIENSQAESDWLLCHVLGCTQTQLLLTREISQEARERFEELLCRRRSGEPVQYLLGRWEFCGLEFIVGKGVLIPRPETEILTRRAVELAKGYKNPVIVDLCAGSGCIGLTAAKNTPSAQVFLIEKSPRAFHFLKRNREHLLAKNCTLIMDDILTLPPICCNILCANPPYIASGELPSLQREVLHEPPEALDGGPDGLMFYRAVAEKWAGCLKPGGAILLELGDGQYRSAAPLFEAVGCAVTAITDQAGHLRIMEATKPKG